MAEYWKSTPKYWCKFCEVYVKDTKLERAQHEATGRHQGNIQRSLRGLHKKQEQEEREKQKAKDEIARLNGLVPGSGSASIAGPAGQSVGKKPTFTKYVPKQATAEDRKRQLAELAALGVAVPDDFRKEVAMVGDWEVVSQKVVEEGDSKPLNIGVRKRKIDEDEAEALAASEAITRNKGWGQTFKRFPGSNGGDDDLNVLFKVKKPAVKEESDVKEESQDANENAPKIKEEPEIKEPALKDVPTAEEVTNTAAKTEEADVDVPIKEEETTPPVPAVVFKKRKKPVR
ncbi:U1 zinc finger domain-containing protein [Delitschia confertaspora ATCC 74209]|uniref:U1 zinc finger domain-containing protein n=1 Tax=Delitschia confertaspora ATCC 74209 TaxID=1513339 RepID=A0A9P4JSQ2_9PLEO|nr:U1 zinc finger domain-containing protein [Delitschia confertaspora ATCC 74209]